MPLVKNLGTSQVGVVSFTQYFGSNVTEEEIEKNYIFYEDNVVFMYDSGIGTVCFPDSTISGSK